MTAGLKICGITRPSDAVACRNLGVDCIGINLWSGSRRGLTLEEAGWLRDTAGDLGTMKVAGVFVDASAKEMNEARARLGLDYVQLHGDRSPDDFGDVGPYLRVIRGTPDLSMLPVPSQTPVWSLLDAAVSGYGGAGHRTDWGWAAAAVVWLAPAPVWLAGGITPENAAQALARVGPAGLDVASGAEMSGAAHGEKDPTKIAALL